MLKVKTIPSLRDMANKLSNKMFNIGFCLMWMALQHNELPKLMWYNDLLLHGAG